MVTAQRLYELCPASFLGNKHQVFTKRANNLPTMSTNKARNYRLYRNWNLTTFFLVRLKWQRFSKSCQPLHKIYPLCILSAPVVLHAGLNNHAIKKTIRNKKTRRQRHLFQSGAKTRQSSCKAWFPLNVSVLATNQSCLLMQTLLRFAGFYRQTS